MDESLAKSNPGRWQFSRRQLLIGVTLFACLLAGIAWFYLSCIYANRFIALKPEDNLADYVGRRVAFTGTADKVLGLDKSDECVFVYFGSQSAGVILDQGLKFEKGQPILVAGVLHLAKEGKSLHWRWDSIARNRRSGGEELEYLLTDVTLN